MVDILIRWLIYSGVIFITCRLLPGIRIKNFRVAIIVAAVLAIINLFVRPILILFTLPITILTLGLFLLIINALMLKLASKMVDGFVIESFCWAVVASMIISFLYSLIYEYQFNEGTFTNQDVVVKLISGVRYIA